jgi:hypothetical protein
MPLAIPGAADPAELHWPARYVVVSLFGGNTDVYYQILLLENSRLIRLREVSVTFR